MNTQDNQGNGLIGGGIGLGVGSAGAYFGRGAVEDFALNRLSNADKYAAQFEKQGNTIMDIRLEVAKEMRKDRNAGISSKDKPHSAYPKYQELRRAEDEGQRMKDEAKAVRSKALPYANAAKLFYMAGLPITSALIGSTLTD